jgi:hypothetical protein
LLPLTPVLPDRQRNDLQPVTDFGRRFDPIRTHRSFQSAPQPSKGAFMKPLACRTARLALPALATLAFLGTIPAHAVGRLTDINVIDRDSGATLPSTATGANTGSPDAPAGATLSPCAMPAASACSA